VLVLVVKVLHVYSRYGVDVISTEPHPRYLSVSGHGVVTG
jgi:hypothetical protein